MPPSRKSRSGSVENEIVDTVKLPNSSNMSARLMPPPVRRSSVSCRPRRRRLLASLNSGPAAGQNLTALAKALTTIRFVGIVEANRVKELNDSVSGMDNLTFVTGPLSEFLVPDTADGCSIVFHNRVAEGTPPSVLGQLYSDCHEFAVRNILVSERMDFDLIDLRFYESGKYPGLCARRWRRRSLVLFQVTIQRGRLFDRKCIFGPASTAT